MRVTVDNDIDVTDTDNEITYCTVFTEVVI